MVSPMTLFLYSVLAVWLHGCDCLVVPTGVNHHERKLYPVLVANQRQRPSYRAYSVARTSDAHCGSVCGGIDVVCRHTGYRLSCICRQQLWAMYTRRAGVVLSRNLSQSEAHGNVTARKPWNIYQLAPSHGRAHDEHPPASALAEIQYEFTVRKRGTCGECSPQS